MINKKLVAIMAMSLGIFAQAALAQTDNLTIYADASTVFVGIPKNVTFTVTQNCPNGSDPCTQGSPVALAPITLSGAASGSGTTGQDGKAVIKVNADSAGTITATATNGSDTGTTTITAKDQPQIPLLISADTSSVSIGTPRNVKFTVREGCPQDTDWACTQEVRYVQGAHVTLSGVVQGGGDTAQDGTVTIGINATERGNITATASKSGYISGSTTIAADYIPSAKYTVGKTGYNRGELVNFTLTNNGPVPIELGIWRIKSGSKTIFLSDNTGVDSLDLGQSVVFSWTQVYTNGSPVPSGTYSGEAVYAYNNKSYSSTSDAFEISCGIYINPPKTRESTVSEPQTFSLNLSKTGDVAWYLDGNWIKTDTGVTYSSYTNSSIGTGVYNVTAVADFGCEKVRQTWTWTVKPKSSNSGSGGSSGGSSGGNSGGGSGGGGGGGGGMTTSEPYTNIQIYERKDADLMRGKPVTYSFSSSEFSIYEVLITGRENEGDVGMRLERLKNTSALVNRNPPGTVYSNENVWLGSKRIDSVVIRFKVSNSWLAENGLDSKDISLLRFDNGWKKLDSTISSGNSTYTYFESKSPGLSSFSITGLKEEIPQTKDRQTSDSEPSPDNTQNQNAGEQKPAEKLPGFGIVAGSGIISAVYLFMRRKQ